MRIIHEPVLLSSVNSINSILGVQSFLFYFIFRPISDINQEKIVEEGGLDALLLLLRSSKSTTILRVASGAIANLAMNGTPESSFFPGLLHFMNLAYECVINEYCHPSFSRCFFFSFLLII